MTSFAPTPEGKAAAERMMREFGHTMGPFRPRPGFPGRSPATSQAQNLPQQTGTGFAGLGQTNLQRLQDMLQGTSIGGIPRQVSQPPAPQQPTGRSGRGTTPATPPSFASQMRGMGLAGMGLAGIPNPTLPEPTGMSPTQSQAVQAVVNKMQGAKLGGFTGMKKGGAVSKADMKKAGFYDKGKTKSERQKIVSKVTTKPQRIAMVEKAFSTKNMKSGGAVSSASKRGDGCAIKGKTRCKIV